MADIKTRDVTRGTIKTLDRAAAGMTRMKEESIRSKAAEIGGRSDDKSGDNAGAYAEEHAERYAGSAALHAAEAGRDLIAKNRQSKGDRPRHRSPKP